MQNLHVHEPCGSPRGREEKHGEERRSYPRAALLVGPRGALGCGRRRKVGRAESRALPDKQIERFARGLRAAHIADRLLYPRRRRRRPLGLLKPRDGLELDLASHPTDGDERYRGRVEGDGKAGREVARRLEAKVRITLECLAEPGVEGGWQLRPKAARDGKHPRRDGGKRHRDPLVSVPDGTARQAFERHAAESPEVRPVVHVSVSLDLLWGHVRGGSEHRTFAGQARRLLVRLDRRVELCEPEIEDFRYLATVLHLAQVDVLRLQIPVDDACSVRLDEPLGDLADDADRRARVDEPDACHAVVERLPLQELHDDERTPVLEAPGVVDLDDVGASHTGGRTGLPEEALDDDRRVGQIRGEDLDCHSLADVDVLRVVNRGHSPASKLAGDPVLAHEQSTGFDLVVLLDGGHE